MQLLRASLALSLVLGVWGSSCVCRKNLDPVCGTDEVTYSNACMLRCARDTGVSSKGNELAVAHTGPCESVPAMSMPSGCKCTKEFRPVCGTDGETYSNECNLNCAKIRGVSSKGADLAVAHKGVCSKALSTANEPAPISSICPSIFDPVCGSDGKTYGSPCMLRSARDRGVSTKGHELAVAHTGACEAVPAMSIPSGCTCTKVFLPVCGTDGETYSNECDLKCAKIRGVSTKGHELAVAHAGPCEAVPAMSMPSGCQCTKEFRPVCGTDGETYSNECNLNCAKIRGVSSKGADLAVAHKGACLRALVAESKLIPHPCICTRLYHPVCGTDGQTYASDCSLNCVRSTGASSKGHGLAVAHAGPCVDVNLVADGMNSAMTSCSCTRILLPVCGTDGNTYDNNCMLKCASKAKGGAIRVAHEGECY